MTGVPAEHLAVLDLFAGCTPGELAEVAARLAPFEAAAGEVLVREGEPASAFLLLASGRARVDRLVHGGDVVLADLGPGAVVGELSLLIGSARAATVTATEPVTGFAGDAHAFHALLDVPCVAPRLARTARQRLAGLVRPVPFRLRDGTGLVVRPVLPGDRAQLAASLEGFSPETMHRRFLVGRSLTQAATAYLFDVDHLNHFVWVVVSPTERLGVADARFIRSSDDPQQAEVAFTVADDYQGRGVGALLVGALAVAARQAGVERFSASVLSDNRPMRHLLDRAGAVWQSAGYGVVETVVDVPDPVAFLPDPALLAPLQDAARRVLSVPG